MNRVLSFVPLLFLLGCGPSAGEAGTGRVAFTGATILVGPHLEPVPSGNLLVESGHIVCVGTAARCPSAGVSEEDIRGAYVVPGLIDAHVHVAEYSALPHAQLYLARGITTVRDMGGRADSALALRRRWRSQPAPNLFLALRPIDGDPVHWPAPFPDVPISAATPDEARAAVRTIAESGADFVKLYHGLDSASLRTAVEEAHASGLKATADLTGWPFATSEAVAAGVDGLEHFIRELGAGTGMPGWPFFDWDRDATELEALAHGMAAEGVALTLTTGLVLDLFGDSFPSHKPTFMDLPAGMQERSLGWWEESRGSRAGPARIGGIGAETRAAVRSRFSEATCRFAGSLHDAGGQVLLGTDAFWQTMLPGDLLGELEWLVDCGFTPRAAVRAATVEPARWLGADSLGVIQAGAVADFVVLEADPLEDIRNMRRIRSVVRRGLVLEPSRLIAEAKARPAPE